MHEIERARLRLVRLLAGERQAERRAAAGVGWVHHEVAAHPAHQGAAAMVDDRGPPAAFAGLGADLDVDVALAVLRGRRAHVPCRAAARSPRRCGDGSGGRSRTGR
jgi:hypothetical protein